MIKQYKMPGLYVLGVPEKSLISFVTFSLSLLVLVVSYLLYFYFQGCPVELALQPPLPVDMEPASIVFDPVIEEQTEQVEAPELKGRFLGWFRGKEETGEDIPIVEENIVEEIAGEIVEEIAEVIVEIPLEPEAEDVPIIQTDMSSESESVEEDASLKDKIIGFFQKQETAENVIDIEIIETEIETPAVEDAEAIATEDIEVMSIKEQIIGFFKKEETTEKAETGTVIDETEIEEEKSLEVAEDEEEALEEKSIKDKILGLFHKTEEAEVKDEAYTEVAQAEPEEQQITDAESNEEQEESTDIEEEKSIKDKIVGFFQKSETTEEQVEIDIVEIETELAPDTDVADDTEIESAHDETTMTETEGEEIADLLEIEDTEKSLKEKIVDFFKTEEIVESELSETEQIIDETLEDSVPSEVSSDDISVEIPLEDGPEDGEVSEDRSIRAAVQDFLSGTVTTLEEAGEVSDVTEEVDLIIEETPEDVEIVSEDKSIKAVVIEFFSGSDDTQTEDTEDSNAILEEEESTVEVVELEEEEASDDRSIQAAVMEFLSGTDAPVEEVVTSETQIEEVSEGVGEINELEEEELVSVNEEQEKTMTDAVLEFFSPAEESVEPLTDDASDEQLENEVIVEVEDVEDEHSEVRSIKATVQGFLSGEEEDKSEELEDHKKESPVDITMELPSVSEEKQNTITDAVFEFFSPTEDSAAEVVEESESIILDISLEKTQDSEIEEVVEDDTLEVRSIKAAVQGFLSVEEEVVTEVPEDSIQQESVEITEELAAVHERDERTMTDTVLEFFSPIEESVEDIADDTLETSLEETETDDIEEGVEIEEDISEVRSIKAAVQGFLSGEEEEKAEVPEETTAEEPEDITEVSAAEDEEERSIKTVVQSFFSADTENADSATEELVDTPVETLSVIEDAGKEQE